MMQMKMKGTKHEQYENANEREQKRKRCSLLKVGELIKSIGCIVARLTEVRRTRNNKQKRRKMMDRQLLPITTK